MLYYIPRRWEFSLEPPKLSTSTKWYGRKGGPLWAGIETRHPLSYSAVINFAGCAIKKKETRASASPRTPRRRFISNFNAPVKLSEGAEVSHSSAESISRHLEEAPLYSLPKKLVPNPSSSPLLSSTYYVRSTLYLDAAIMRDGDDQDAGQR